MYVCVCVNAKGRERDKSKEVTCKRKGCVCVCKHVNIYPYVARLQSPQDNVWRGMFLIGLLAMQLSSRAMPPVRHGGVNNWG